MEDYVEVVIKTVRDLFRSYPLIQIKKYMMSKEGEISDKDSELKSLILEQYTSLTHGFNSLEKISTNLESLENTRKDFDDKMNQINLNKIEISLQNIPLNNDLIDIIQNKNNFVFDEINEKIENLMKEKKYKESINEMIILKKYIDNIKKEYNDEVINLKEKYYFLLVELFENVLNIMIEDGKICENIEQYKILLDDIFQNLIKDKYEESMEYLIMIELFLKILYDKNIKKIMEEYFNSFKDDNQNYFSINILLKILFLKISQILYDISITPIELLFDELMLEKYFSIYETVMCIKLICEKYCNINNNRKIDLNNFYSFIKSEINKNMNPLLIISKNSFKKINLYITINFWNKLFSKINSNILRTANVDLLEFFYLDKSIEQISNITSYMIQQYSFSNLFNLKMLLKNKNIKSENDIYLSLSELNKINNGNNYKDKFKSVLKKKLYQFFSNINNNITDKLNNDNNKIEYINIINKIITFNGLIKIFEEFQFKDIMTIINELIEKNQVNDYLKIKNYINDTFKLELKFELFLDNEEKNKYEENGISEALNQLIELLYEYEIKDREHKNNIYLNIIEVYSEVIKDSLLSQKTDLNLINKIFMNDIFILYNIKTEQRLDDKLQKIMENINNIFKINIKNINKNINDFTGYKFLNEFFTTNEYINKNIEFTFNMKKYINNKPKKVEYFPIYSNKMNVHMLNKSKIDYSNRENNKISTCYIYDYRIEENYLSIRQDNSSQNENNIQNSNGNKTENNNMFGNITGKIFNLINDD